MPASAHATPISRREDALAVVRKLVDAGHVAYFAGGCVRDQLLGREPKDFDVATDATPDRVRELFLRSQGVGQAFGVVIVRVGRSQIEVATFRADGAYGDGRRPDEVRFATAEEDAQRRDFTINGLFYDPLADRVIDFVGGQADLKAGMLRAIGEPAVRFAEDYLRILRAVRFAARFGLSIDPATAEAIRANAHKLPRIAPERIADELRAMLVPAGDLRRQAHRWLDQLNITPILFRGVLGAMGLDGTPAAERGGCLIDALPSDRPMPFSLAMAAWSTDIVLGCGRPIAVTLDAVAIAKIERALRQSLKLSNDESASLKGVLSVGRLLPPHPSPTVAELKRFLAHPHAADGLTFLKTLADCGHVPERVNELLSRAAAFDAREIAPPPLVNGDDLQACGYRPGPGFKTVLDAVYDAQLESRLSTREAALELVRKLMGATGS